MTRLIFQVAVGQQSALYEHCIKSVNQYCKLHDIEHIVLRKPVLRICPDIFATNRSKESYTKHGGFLPVYEKQRAFDYFDQCEQIAIIDADIYIRPNAPNIFDQLSDNCSFGACVERDMPITTEYAKKIHNYSHMQYQSLKDVDWEWNGSGAKFYNMGVIVMNKSIVPFFKGQDSRQFLDRVEFKRFIDGDGAWKWSFDQTLLNWWIKKENDLQVADIDWRFNALYKGVKDENIKDAYFIHFFLKDKLPNGGEDVETLMKDIGQ